MTLAPGGGGAGRPRVLVLAHLLPWPLEGGGQIKSYHTLRVLASRYDLTMLAFIRDEKERENVAPLLPLCAGGVEVVRLPRGRARDGRVAFSSLVSGRSFLIARDGSPEMRAAVAARLAAPGAAFAAVHVDHLQMAQFIPPDAATGGARVVLDEHNVEYRIPQRVAETPGVNPLMRWYAGVEWPRLRAFERDACRRADLTLAVSEEDAEELRRLAPDRDNRIRSVPIGVDTEYFAVADRAPEPRTLLSVGTMYWPPNVDAMRYFCAEILPKVRASVPDARLNIVGAKPTAAVRALGEANPGVTVTGWVPDVRPYGEDCGAFVVPLRSGSGMRVKILNALAMGLPVVSTTVGAEGIEVTDGENILLADGAEAFADAVVRLLRDPALGRRLGAAGRRLMEERYSWDAVGGDLLAAYDHVLSARERVPTP